MNGHRRDPRRPQKKKPLSNGWIVVPSKTYPDRVYFFNTVTRCSTWDNPCEDTNIGELNNSSSDTSSSERNLSFKTKIQSTGKSKLKKHKSQPISLSPQRISNNRVSNEIEDYDDQDEYFANSPKNSMSYSHLNSPSSSPGSASSSKTNCNDSDKYFDSNELFENNKKQLWSHFVSNPKKPILKKSVALSDFQGPSTSQNSGMKMNNQIVKNAINVTQNKKKKKKKKQSSNKKNCPIPKINKNMSFKRTDKTPAQTNLLKLMKENAEKVRALAAEYPEFGMHNTGANNSKKRRSSTACDSEKQIQNDKFNGGYLKSNETCPNTTQETGNQLGVDYWEEMDWEPSSEESDVRNINEFRQQLDKTREISSDFFVLNSSQLSALPCQTHSCFLILDTNIFVSCLHFVKELRDARVPDLGYPVIYVPWRVLQELDHLKDSKIAGAERNLHVNVRRAIAYLNDNFKLRHPRIFGQSFEDFSKMIGGEAFAPDDEILQTCIQLQKQHCDKKSILLTNDKNLESKAIVSGVEVYSKDRFQKKYLRPDSSSTLTKTVNKLANERASPYEFLCEVKEILKDFLSNVVETELTIAFEENWIKLVVKKPPWSLQDVMQCLLKHWRSVFFVIFSRNTHSEVEALYERFFKREAVTTEEITDIIRRTQRLIEFIRKSQYKKRPYHDFIPTIMGKLSNMLSVLSTSAQAEIISEFTTIPSQTLDSQSNFSSHQMLQNETPTNDVLNVKTLFKDIWDYLRSFCCSVSDVINSSHISTDTVVQETRLKLSQILNESREFVATVEKILEINPTESNEGHPLIVHFSNFVIHAYPNIVPVLNNELPRCLAAFFRDFEGRTLLTNALKDFKEFLLNLSEAAQYFNGQNAC